ncbi:SMC domain protein [Cylindrospermum sp. NIES-4074]|nr:SMC domain protein [Cylindrospermum sp. NIES-4074]
MFIKTLQVFNYKSYSDSGEMEFAPGINIIVGRNNAGKTSLLEVLTLDFEDHPHKSIKTLPNKSSTIEQKSKIKITLHIGKGEWRDFIQYISTDIGIPIPGITKEFTECLNSLAAQNSSEDEEDKSKKNIRINFVKEQFTKFKISLDKDNKEINLFLYANKIMDDISLTKLLNFETYEVWKNPEDLELLQIEYNTQHQDFYILETESEGYFGYIKKENSKFENSIGYKIFDIYLSRIYRFKAERLNIGVCKFENNNGLKTDASNLAEVICILQGKNPGMFAQFNELVSRILPEIKWISVVPRDNSDVEIIVWTIEPKFNRDDLSLPLSLCGSGVSQVLAIVYILVSSEEARTIIIDEPQSFLHPGAARKLIETIKQFPQHQYFIATHSPDIITTADPSNIIKLQYQDCETTASVVNSKEIESQQDILDELGVRLSDVFGADNILWVEGETEEKCFPLILKKVLDKQLRGTKILGVKNTGDFQGTRAKIIFDIYQKLSGGTGLFPPAIGFLFDSENRTEEEKDNLRGWEKSGKPVEFLSRCMYENYLLDSEAIAAVFNAENQSLQESLQEPLSIHITSLEVEEWLEKKKREKGISEEEWLYTIHASNILEQLFSNFSNRKFKFRKPKHSEQLTKWLVEYKPDFLLGLAEEVAKMLNY